MLYTVQQVSKCTHAHQAITCKCTVRVQVNNTLSYLLPKLLSSNLGAALAAGPPVACTSAIALDRRDVLRRVVSCRSATSFLRSSKLRFKYFWHFFRGLKLVLIPYRCLFSVFKYVGFEIMHFIVICH